MNGAPSKAVRKWCRQMLAKVLSTMTDTETPTALAVANMIQAKTPYSHDDIRNGNSWLSLNQHYPQCHSIH